MFQEQEFPKDSVSVQLFKTLVILNEVFFRPLFIYEQVKGETMARVEDGWG